METVKELNNLTEFLQIFDLVFESAPTADNSLRPLSIKVFISPINFECYDDPDLKFSVETVG